MSDHAAVYEIRGYGDAPPLPVSRPDPAAPLRWAYQPGAAHHGVAGALLMPAPGGGGRWRVQVWVPHRGGRRVGYIAECAAGPEGEYVPLATGPYNLGGGPVTVVRSDAAPAGETEDGRHARQRAALSAALESLAPPAPGSGRGVVIVGGGPYFASAYVTLRVLRHVGCDLPAELWHSPGEVGPRERAIVEAMGCVCVECGAGPGGWGLKSRSVLNSRFAEVLYLDADSYPTRDPTFLFDHPKYLEHGAVFWRDKPDHRTPPGNVPSEAAWRAVGLEPRDEPAFESGQFVVDRGRCWRELALADWMNRRAAYYCSLPGVYGDKDLFHFAWRLLGADYAMPPRQWDWSVHTMLQYDPDGREVLFQHRNRDKLVLDAAKRSDGRFINGQIADHNVFNPALAHEGFCFRCVDELRQLLAAPAPPPTPSRTAEVFAADLAGVDCKIFRVAPPVHHDAEDLTVSVGGAAVWGGRPARWAASGERVSLSRDGQSVQFRRQPDGTWVGDGGGLWMVIPQ